MSVENDNFEVEEYPCTEFGVNDLDGCFSFCLKNQIFFCADKNVYSFNPIKELWIKISKRLDKVRFGAASVSLKEGAIVAGGRESDGKGVPELTDSCVLLKQENDKLVVIKIGRLPLKVRHHTMTKISDDSFIMCGGSDFKGHEINDAYFGTLVKSQPVEERSGRTSTHLVRPPNLSQEWHIRWRKLPNMWEWRSNHFAMFTNDRFYVFGGGPRRTEKQHLKELNLKYCGFDLGLFAGTKVEVLTVRIKGDKVYCGTKFQPISDICYDISFANLVMSPDEQYCVVAGGEIYGDGAKKIDNTFLTMSTRSLILRALGDKSSHDEDESLFTNKIWKKILTCNCLTPMDDD